MEITRRQLLGAGLGLVGTGLLATGAGAAPSSFSLLQTAHGRRVRSGRTVSARYPTEVRKGSLLVAVVSRHSRATLAPTVGEVSDDEGNHWRQAVEYFTDGHYGVDIWYCESAKGGGRLAVTAVCLAYPVRPGTDGMRMSLLEYAGADGFELCDQICQANIDGDLARVTTSSGLAQNGELAITAIVGDVSGAAPPSGWNIRVADPTQGCYVADTLSTGPASAGTPLQATWTNVEPVSEGAAVLATFVPRGVSSRSRRLVQSSYTDSAILPAGAGHARWRSQAFPVNPARGNTLVAFMNGSIYHPRIDCGSIVSVHDTAGGRWQKMGESGPDDRTGINISCWVCDDAPGGTTALIPKFSNASQQLSCLLLEFANLPKRLRPTNVSRRSFGGDLPPLTTTSPVGAGEVAFAYRTDVFILPQGPGPGWKQVMSDTTGANAMVMLDTPPGQVTASWSGRVVQGTLDLLLLTLAGVGGAAPST